MYAEAAGSAPLWSGCIDFGNASLNEHCTPTNLHVLLICSIETKQIGHQVGCVQHLLKDTWEPATVFLRTAGATQPQLLLVAYSLIDMVILACFLFVLLQCEISPDLAPP